MYTQLYPTNSEQKKTLFKIIVLTNKHIDLIRLPMYTAFLQQRICKFIFLSERGTSLTKLVPVYVYIRVHV